jgi:mono/diheme cytochrome c family protein
MKKLGKVLLGIAGLLVLIVLGVIAYISLALPSVKPAPDITISSTSEVVTRGSYLANHVTVCTDCHSTRDWSKYSGPIIPGTVGKGGEKFSHEFGFPGTFYSKNITPYNIGAWTDGELYRVITTGVTREDEPLFPVMPYKSYGQMDPDDIKAIIAYLRTLEPIRNDVAASKADFPMNLIMRTIPGNVEKPGKRPPVSDTVAYGRYIATISACNDCHTPQDKGQPLEGMYLAGGFEFRMPGGIVRSSNITPHPTNGIGAWTAEQFVQRFKHYEKPENRALAVAPGQPNTVMPWTQYAGMTETDLRAIYAYLRTVQPNPHAVEKFTPMASAH